MRILHAAMLATLCLLGVATTASAAPPPEAVMSPNVEYLGSIKQGVGLTTGAKIVGDRMFVTSGKNISIYDISDPASPKPLGAMKTNINNSEFSVQRAALAEELEASGWSPGVCALAAGA